MYDDYYNVSKTEGANFIEIRTFATTKRKGAVLSSKHKRTNVYSKNVESRKRSNHRAKKNILDIIKNNFYAIESSFITLTFRENIQDIRICNQIFKSFMRKLKRHISKEIKYLCIIEFQKRGAVHYHMLVDIVNFDYKTVIDMWNRSINQNHRIRVKGGSVRVEKVSKKSTDKITNYITKYITKSLGNPKLLGEKCYFTSRAIKRSKKTTHFIEDLKKKDILTTLDINGHLQTKNYYTDSYTGTLITYYMIEKYINK